MTRAWKSVVALSGGVGGARLIRGLARALPPEVLTTVVNTGDDFEHWGLSVSPDVDTVMYALAGLSHEERGWGLADETFRALEALRAYGEEGWFAIGDRDLATHMARTLGMARGETLTQATARLCKAHGIASRVLPMSDGRRPTRIDTREHGALTFQNWFVRHRTEPAALRVWFDGTAGATPEVLEAVRRADLVVIGPSNPYVSIDPILTLPGVHEALFAKPARVVAVSPIVHGQAIKGPLAVMIPGLAGTAPSAAAIAAHYDRYGGLAGLVVEQGDAPGSLPTLETSTVMRSPADSEALARAVLDFAAGLVTT
ncbi:MAG: 2-phospho-L-lactate transferase [Polyangiaceae bacterium]